MQTIISYFMTGCGFLLIIPVCVLLYSIPSYTRNNTTNITFTNRYTLFSIVSATCLSLIINSLFIIQIMTRDDITKSNVVYNVFAVFFYYVALVALILFSCLVILYLSILTFIFIHDELTYKQALINITSEDNV